MKRVVPDAITLAVGVRIRRLRTELGLSIREVSRRARLNKGHIVDVENGVAATSTRTLKRFADALGVTPADLMNFNHHDPRGAIYESMRRNPDLLTTISNRTN